MRHLKFRLILLLVLGMSLSLCSWAKNIVWEQPYATRYSGDVDITRVEFKPDETVVTLSWLGDGDIRMASSTYLRVDTMKYMIRKHPDTPLDEWFDATTKPAIFHFAPLPDNTRQFDLIEETERGFRVNAVVNLSDTVLALFPSDWRNDATGDWMLSLLPEKVIFNSRVWDYIDRKEDANGCTTVSIACGEERHTISISLEKNQIRKISIDGGNPIACSRVVKHFLPDYPVKDLRATFVDTDYMPDTAVIRGWLYGMDKKMWKKSKEFEVSIENIFTKETEKFSVKMDSVGRFEMKIRLYGASEAYVDWGRSNIHTVIEPGIEYFLLVNYRTMQKFFMGEDCRLQNEMLHKHPLGSLTWPNAFGKNYPVECSTGYMDTLRTDYAEIKKKIKKLVIQHPNLSTRYLRFTDDYYRSYIARNLGQYSFNINDRQLSAQVKDYLISEYCLNIPHPYTLHRELSTFIEDIRNAYQAPHRNMSGVGVEKRGLIKLTDAERKIIQMKDSVSSIMRSLYQARVGTDSLNRWYDRTQWVLKVRADYDSLMSTERGKEIKAVVSRFRDELPTHILDTLKVAPDMRDICAVRDFYSKVQRNNKYYTDGTYESLHDSLRLPAAREFIQTLHDKYVVLEKQNTYAIKNTSDVKGMTDGEAILSKLTEPYRGRCIVLDVWGTWCGPCKAALRDSKHEFEALDPLNVVYLYLANRSEQKAWENFIKENNLTGPNCVHYNLPQDQQSAIENFLGVNGYPSYFLIDPEGHVLEKKIDARRHGIDEVVKLVKELNGKHHTSAQ